MKPNDIMLACGTVAMCTASVTFTAFLLRPKWFARLVSDAFLIRHSLWDECDGEPMNVWAEEFVRRDELPRRAPATGQSEGGEHAD